VRKLLVAAVAVAVAVAGFAVVSQAGQGEQGTSWEFKYKPAKKDKAVGTDSLIEPARQMPDGTYAETKKTTIYFTPGTEFDTAVPPRCKKDAGEVVSTNGQACKKAQIGQGDALSQIGALETAAELKAYNRKSGILFLVIACNPGTGPGQADPNCTPLDGGTFALEGKLKYQDTAKTKPFLVVPTPQTLLDGNIIITKFHLETNKRVENGETYVESPPKCRKGKFKTKAVIQYDGGVPSQTIKDSQAC
jgi:hypothetical protein